MDIAFPKNNEFKEDILLLYPYKNHFKSKDKFTAYKANGDDRKAFEKGINLIYHLEFGKRKDFIFSRNSGMNQVLAKIAKEKNVVIGFSFNDFAKAKNRAEILGRMQQNMRLCRKYKVKTLVASFATKTEELQDEITLKAFERLLNKRKMY